MTGFAAEWLALRAPADAKARSRELMGQAARHAVDAAGDGPVRIVDLGCGTGATLRALAPLIAAPQAWTLIDADTELLAEAERLTAAHPPAPHLSLATQCADLTAGLPWHEPPHLVAASALFDITSAEFVGTLAARLAADGTPLLALLIYDGAKTVDPPDSFDAEMLRFFNDHQRGEKSFGQALGPDAPAALQRELEAVGATVTLASSPWVLTRDSNGALIDAMVEGWAAAATEAAPDREGEIVRWREAHAGAQAMQVGHCDLWARFSA
ncbi:MAG: class I SAM-dependent methyltransferase [Pseudomonadota bacterium]